MNVLTLGDFKDKLGHYVRAAVRFLDPIRRVDAFSSAEAEDAIGRVYAINLDRKPMRWNRTRSEFNRFRGRDRESLAGLTRRFSAIDARCLGGPPSPEVLIPTFTLAEQLTVNPNPFLEVNDDSRMREIEMTRPEIAVALSHIEVWRLIAAGDVEYVLVVEDDVMMRPGFATSMNREWTDLVRAGFELLYLAYRDVGEASSSHSDRLSRRTQPGLWEASGYVLSRGGAKKLLALLPAHGPIDLWLNLVLDDLKVFTTKRPVLEQRLAEVSTNSYSVLPVLSQVGVITREKPLIPVARRLRDPVIAVGPADSGLSSLALALTMLGYAVASDLDKLPELEQSHIVTGRRSRMFGAYVNVGSVEPGLRAEDHRARFIVTDTRDLGSIPEHQVLRLLPDVVDKWAAVTDFLDLEYPSFAYPDEDERGQRVLRDAALQDNRWPSRDLRWDRSPWIVSNPRGDWGGTPVSSLDMSMGVRVTWRGGAELEGAEWTLRDDTFPSNLALFRPGNVSVGDLIELTLSKETTSVREYAAGAIASRRSHLYGTFSAELKPTRGSGVITGLFLHRNGPRQEIDIEFLGRDTTKMLINVFYNPGPLGTKLEYGYRGTPTEIDLGFDAAEEFHLYEINWQSDRIDWKVDGDVVYSRAAWNPTPIPDRPLEFNINTWTSRSVEFAGRLEPNELPVVTRIRSIEIAAPIGTSDRRP